MIQSLKERYFLIICFVLIIFSGYSQNRTVHETTVHPSNTGSDYSSITTSNKHSVILFRHDVFINGQNGYHTYRIPAMVVTNKGTVLVFCEGRKKEQPL